jgi:uncharacterized protein YjbJ (UPF0337 family)
MSFVASDHSGTRPACALVCAIDGDKEKIVTNPQREQLQGKGEQLIGGAKESMGRATGDEQTEIEGQAQQDQGKVRETIGGARETVEDAAEDVKRTITGR